jgi:hypothetical protein
LNELDKKASTVLYVDRRGISFRWKGVQMRSEDTAKTSHYTGPINVMTVREVSSYLQVHPSTI